MLESAVLIKLMSIGAVALIASVSALAAAIGDSNVAARAVDGVARQPEARASIFSTMLIGIGLVEATPIIALVIALILLYVNPLI